jgi:aspartokinase/homoserine dehydrogenase 1
LAKKIDLNNRNRETIMKVLKFGGSSLADAKCFKHVASILNNYLSDSDISVVLSAPQGITNQLVALTDAIKTNQTTEPLVNDITDRLSGLLNTTLNNENSEAEAYLDQLIIELKQRIQGADLLSHCPDSTQAQILSTGEKFSIMLLKECLKELGHQPQLIDPENFLTTDNRITETIVDLVITQKRFAKAYPKLARVSLMPGFFGVKPNGETTTLGRNGSDYSAAVLAVCVKADICEIWTDVDGVYNADPRLVKEAKLIKKMSYLEAMELSYFGAKVLHPKTITPLSVHKIPCRIKNTHSPQAPGTLISEEASNGDSVKAISNLSNVAMINVSGPGMKGMVGMASRVFSAISRADISIVMISQSSAEYCISFCIPEEHSEAGRTCLEQEFELELKNKMLDPISVRKELSIVTLVGDKMEQQRGIAAKFFRALSQAAINIIAIAQDSSERSISAVISNQRAEDAIKVCHRNLFTRKQSIDAFVIGCGTIGKELINQIYKQQTQLESKNIQLNLVGIANSKKILLNKNGIDSNNWQADLAEAQQSFNLETINQFVSESHLGNPVIIDCTSSETISMQYKNFLANNYHLVTANKKANTADFSYYQAMREAAQNNARRFLYETNVGAGLPVIDNLQSLINAGDSLIQFEGILSGSLSYIFGELENGLSLSEVTMTARELGYTEPNPAEDLNGLDVARKLLVIAREFGLTLELDDIQLNPVVPKALADLTDADEFMKKLPSVDAEIKTKVEQAQQENKVLRYIGSIENGQCKVDIQAVDVNHPLYAIKNGENALSLNTAYYDPCPLVIRGYGAGATVTAAGLFTDLLKTVSWDKES